MVAGSGNAMLLLLWLSVPPPLATLLWPSSSVSNLNLQTDRPLPSAHFLSRQSCPGLPTAPTIKSNFFHCPFTLSLALCCNSPLAILQNFSQPLSSMLSLPASATPPHVGCSLPPTFSHTGLLPVLGPSKHMPTSAPAVPLPEAFPI